MRKHIILFVLFFVFFSGSIFGQIAEKYTEPGRHIWNRRDVLVETEEDLKEIARAYRITTTMKIAVIGNDQQAVEDAKEVFNNFGFHVMQDNYRHLADYTIEVEKEDRQDRYSGTYGYYGSSSGSRRVSTVKLVVFDSKSGTERYYTGAGEYRYAHYYTGYYYHNSYYQNDPGRMSSKIAIMMAIAEFIDGENIPHQIPQKKR